MKKIPKLIKEKLPGEIIEKRAEILGKIVQKTTIERLKKYVGKTIECFFDGLTEDKLFYTARPKLWEMEIDGDILINESEKENLKIGDLVKVKVNELAKDELIGKIVI